MSSQTNAEVNRATEVGAIEWNVVEVKAGPGRKLQVRFADGTAEWWALTTDSLQAYLRP